MNTDPIVKYINLEAAPPSLQDNTADIDRLKKAVATQCQGRIPLVGYGNLSQLAQRFRKANFSGTAVVNDLPAGMEIVDFVEGKPEKLAAIALDLGTTHLEASLINLLTGEQLASANQLNSQVEYGADILSRMHYAAKAEGLSVLHDAVISDINILASRLAVQAGLQKDEIRAISVSGNPTMVHLFLHVDPYYICREPYIPTVNFPDPFKAAEVGLEINHNAPVFVLPGIGSYFGGDLLSGILSSGIYKKEETSMLIDVGTNAEVVLGNKHWLIACAGAAGPALESGVAKMGMRAGPGAIEHVEVVHGTDELLCRTIGSEKPKGLCGSGIIDLVAALYLTRVIDIRGKFRKSVAGKRLSGSDAGPVFTVVPAEAAADNKPVVLGQVDLDALMRSKAAMYAILTTLVNQVGVSFSELDRIYVAGAFGRHIDPKQAITLGMLPDLPLDTYEPLGNSSLSGAQLVLLDGQARSDCRQLVSTITYIELNVNQEFMMRFSGSKFIPHTDRSLFPSVPVLE